MEEKEEIETFPHWVQSTEQLLRAWIFELMASPDLDGKTNVEYMDMYFNWCLKGELPKSEKETPIEFKKLRKYVPES